VKKRRMMAMPEIAEMYKEIKKNHDQYKSIKDVYNKDQTPARKMPSFEKRLSPAYVSCKKK
jgi:hypothetical protein